MFDFDNIANLMADLDEDGLLGEVRKIVATDVASVQGTMEAMQRGMETVGQRFECGEYFVSDLIYAGEVMTTAMGIIKPTLTSGTGSGLGRLILCTVKNDLHDIGKNIVKATFEAGGFEVVDLGIDVAPERIVEAAKTQDVGIVALSGVLTLALDSMKATVDAFVSAGLRGSVKIIIGGSPVTEESMVNVGADGWARSPQKGLAICRAWACNAL